MSKKTHAKKLARKKAVKARRNRPEGQSKAKPVPVYLSERLAAANRAVDEGEITSGVQYCLALGFDPVLASSPIAFEHALEEAKKDEERQRAGTVEQQARELLIKKMAEGQILRSTSAAPAMGPDMLTFKVDK